MTEQNTWIVLLLLREGDSESGVPEVLKQEIGPFHTFWLLDLSYPRILTEYTFK